MSKLRCRCGYVMVVNTMEEDFLYDLIPQNTIGKVLDSWEEIKSHPNPDRFLEIYMKSRIDVYKCPVCGRILIADELKSDRYDSYIKETK